MGNKTIETKEDARDFINSIADEERKNDCQKVAEIMQKVTGEQPKIWGASIVGFGSYHYKYESGREGEWFPVGFSPRKANLTLYIAEGFAKYDELMQKLGKHKTGKSCLYIKKLTDIDLDVLEELIIESVKSFKEKY
jgi:hypothetical protein